MHNENWKLCILNHILPELRFDMLGWSTLNQVCIALGLHDKVQIWSDDMQSELVVNLWIVFLVNKRLCRIHADILQILAIYEKNMQILCKTNYAPICKFYSNCVQLFCRLTVNFMHWQFGEKFMNYLRRFPADFTWNDYWMDFTEPAAESPRFWPTTGQWRRR